MGYLAKTTKAYVWSPSLQCLGKLICVGSLFQIFPVHSRCGAKTIQKLPDIWAKLRWDLLRHYLFRSHDHARPVHLCTNVLYITNALVPFLFWLGYRTNLSLWKIFSPELIRFSLIRILFEDLSYCNLLAEINVIATECNLFVYEIKKLTILYCMLSNHLTSVRGFQS